jgi:acyl dehydratase
VKASELEVGATSTGVLVEGLTRTQIVMYAGASGDYNPLHTDEVYATEVAGYDSVIAHGQLSLALSAMLVTRWVDEAELTRLGVRFKAQVWPGDTLRATATVASVEDGSAELTLVTTNQDDAEVVTGYATLRDL